MDTWQITDSGITIPTTTYKQGETIEINQSVNTIYRITGPNTNILLAASQIHSTTTSDDGQFLCILASRNYDIEYGLQDHFDPNNFIIIYPYAVKYEPAGGITSYKFTAGGVEIKLTWSHPLSRTRINKILIINAVTGDIRQISETREDVILPVPGYITK
ncbi:Hypothetical protein HVR_LOCUS145 [uncultured virus]|nr:Hypothetical protein HVR_LOCUS145 [uncultured virus]